MKEYLMVLVLRRYSLPFSVLDTAVEKAIAAPLRSTLTPSNCPMVVFAVNPKRNLCSLAPLEYHNGIFPSLKARKCPAAGAILRKSVRIDQDFRPRRLNPWTYSPIWSATNRYGEEEKSPRRVAR